MKVLLEQGVWIADVEGDQGITLEEDHAQEFYSAQEAYKALAEARKYEPFINAELQEDLI